MEIFIIILSIIIILGIVIIISKIVNYEENQKRICNPVLFNNNKGEPITMADTLTTVLNDVKTLEQPLTLVLSIFGKAQNAPQIIQTLDQTVNATLSIHQLANPNFSNIEQIIEPLLETALNVILPGMAPVIINYIKIFLAFEPAIANLI